jgi:hypothetical protein
VASAAPAFFAKADAKVRTLFLTTKLFRKFFLVFLFTLVSLALYAKGKEGMKE